jgi:hypothetical protein
LTKILTLPLGRGYVHESFDSASISSVIRLMPSTKILKQANFKAGQATPVLLKILKQANFKAGHGVVVRAGQRPPRYSCTHQSRPPSSINFSSRRL